MEYVDTLIRKGKIYTLKEEGDLVEALAIDKGKIIFAGSKDESQKYIASEIVDLGGKTVISGMGDSHLHLYAYCQNKALINLESVKSMDALIQTIRARALETEKGRWLKGVGFDQNKYPESRLPNRWDLDKISREHPIVIRRCCLHVMVANSLAIEMASITEEDIKKFDGLIELDDRGEMTGIFREAATSIFDDIVPDPLSEAEVKQKIMLEVFDEMVSKGITIIHTYSANIWNYFEDIDTYRLLESEGKLPIRIIVNLDELFENDGINWDDNPYIKVKYGSYKLFTDGSLGARTAALMEPYSDDKDNYGILVDRHKLYNELLEAYSRGLQPAIHAIGDRAIQLCLDAIEYAIDKCGYDIKRKPFRIINAQLVNQKQLKRMKELPVVLDIQPIFLCTDLYWVDSRLGSKRVDWAYMWKTLMENGIIMAGGSDCPVESFDPIKGIHAAVTRKDFNGFPKDGWHPEEKLSVYQAICLFSKNIAYMTGDEDILGTLEEGKYADFVVLDKDPFTIEPDNLKDIKVLATYVAGKKVY